MLEELRPSSLNAVWILDGSDEDVFSQPISTVDDVCALVRAEFGLDRVEFVLEDFEHSEVDRVFEDEVERADGMCLSDSVDAADSLFDAGWCPRQVPVDDDMGELEIHALAAGVGRHEDVRGVPESLLGDGPLAQAHLAVDGGCWDSLGIKDVDEHLLRRTELGEHQDLQVEVLLLAAQPPH